MSGYKKVENLHFVMKYDTFERSTHSIVDINFKEQTSFQVDL